MSRFPTQLCISLAITIVWFVGVITVQAQPTNSSCAVDVSKPGVAVVPICRGQQIEAVSVEAISAFGLG